MIDSNSSIEEAWAECNSDPRYKDKFDQHSKLFGWPNDWSINPFWAYWCASFVIRDQWLVAEDLITQDQLANQKYDELISQLSAMKILGHSTQEDPDFTTNSEGIITGQRELQPLSQRTSPTIEQVADEIAKKISVTKAQRKDIDDEDDITTF